MKNGGYFVRKNPLRISNKKKGSKRSEFSCI